MNNAFSKIFWGYLLVLIEIHLIVIDILPDPLGYFLILTGIMWLIKDYPIANKAKNLAIALIFISIPTVFIQQNTGTDQHLPVLSGWSFYMTLLGILKLILVFYIFQLIMVIVQKYGDGAMTSRASKTFTVYITVMFLVHISDPFMINFAGSALAGIIIITVVISLIMEIVFLMLLWSLRKMDSNE